MKQIVHIFRKDCRRLWPIIGAVLLLTVLHGYGVVIETPGGGMAVGMSPYTLFIMLVALSGLLLPIAFFLLVVSVVQEESLVGSDQFWLTRPYKRRSLVLEKLLFVIVWAVLPMLVHDVTLIRHFDFSLPSAFDLLIWKQAQFGLFLLVAAALAALSSGFGRTVLLAIGSLLVLVLAFYAVLQHSGEMNLTPSSDVYIGVALLALTVLGAICVLAYQYRYRRATLSRLLGVGFLFACALLVRFWPNRITAYWSSRGASPLLESVQLRPDANLKGIGRSGLPQNAPIQGHAIYYPFQATGLPADVGVSVVGISAQFAAAGQRAASLASSAQVRFQPVTAGESLFADAIGSYQLVSFIMFNNSDFERLKGYDGTVSGKLFLQGYRTARVRVPVPRPKESRYFAIAGRRCQVESYIRESRIGLVFQCVELEPGNTSRFDVRLLQNSQELLPSQAQGQNNTAGSWPALLSPIMKSSYHCEFQLPVAQGDSPGESVLGLELEVFSEKSLGTVDRDFRIAHFRPAELDLHAWEQRGVLPADSTAAQSNNEISPNSK